MRLQENLVFLIPWFGTLVLPSGACTCLLCCCCRCVIVVANSVRQAILALPVEWRCLLWTLKIFCYEPLLGQIKFPRHEKEELGGLKALNTRNGSFIDFACCTRLKKHWCQRK